MIDKINKKYHDLFNHLLSDLKEQNNSESDAYIQNAFSLLIKNRESEKRIYGKDFIRSVLDAAGIAVREIGLGHTSVLGLFIHHAIHGSIVKFDKIKQEYGDAVAIIVEGLSKVSKINEKTSSSQAENFRGLLLNLASDVRVILIRLSEQLELMREMKRLSPGYQYQIASEAAFLYAPLAHRLGLYLIKSEMEDLSLKYTDRPTYDMIAKKLAATMHSRKNFINRFIEPIELALTEQGFKFEIKGRPKSIYSIWNKMTKKEVLLEDIYDLFAIRIILKSTMNREKADCWQAYSTVTDIYQPNPLRLRDWISVPKSNGYESLHTTVIGPNGNWVEIQIRTDRMNEIAEKGVAAHWKYKGQEGEQGIDGWLNKIREILETPEPDADDFIDDFKLSLYSKEIFVFTPKGDLRKFPEKASVLDFAYDIHTDVGASCIGAKVNGKAVPIRFNLHNGDKVEILTSKNQKPKMDWLNFVVTSKAQKKIRQQVNEDLVKEAENGKEIIKRRFKNWKLEYNDEIIRKLLKKFNMPNAQEFYYMVSKEKIDLSQVKEYILSLASFEEPLISTLETDIETQKKYTSVKDEDYLIIDENVENLDYKLAKCCSPIMGDRVFGFVTIGEGIKIHRTNCPNAAQLMGKYGYRIVSARWRRKGTISVFSADIRIKGEDHTGILNSISEAITKEMKINVRSISLDANDGIFSGTISLLVHDIDHLELLIRRLSSIKGVYEVVRADRSI